MANDNNLEQIFARFPVLSIGNYVLRSFSFDDIVEYLEYLSDSDVNRYVPQECIPDTLDRAKEEIEYLIDLFRYRRSIYWAIADKTDNKLVGSVGFNYWSRDHHRGELSYDLKRSLWGKGIMSEAVKQVVYFAFVHMRMHRIEATVTETNKGSLKILSKLKFKKEGVLRDQKLLHGKYHDAIMFSLLDREYLKF